MQQYNNPYNNGYGGQYGYNPYGQPPVQPSVQSVYSQPGAFMPGFGPSFPPFDFRRAAQNEEKRNIRRLALYAGLAMLGYFIVQSILISLIQALNLMDLYMNDFYFQTGFSILYSVAAVGLPFYLLYNSAKKQKLVKMNSFAAPRGRNDLIPLIIVGFGLCIASSYITYLFASLFQNFGVTLPYENTDPPMTASGIALLFIGTAVIPALIEEFAIRGFLLQSLRKYGDPIAIILSSLVFSLLHANAIQIPFAFLAGMVLGYVYCLTDSIWPSIIVHFLNNAFSCAESVIFTALPEEKAMQIDVIMTVTIGVISLLALAFVLKKKNFRLKQTKTYLETSQKAKAFILQPLFLIVACSYIIITLVEVYAANR